MNLPMAQPARESVSNEGDWTDDATFEVDTLGMVVFIPDDE